MLACLFHQVALVGLPFCNLLRSAGYAVVQGQSANHSPSPSIVERIKEQTLSDHGVNVTEYVPTATNASETVQNLTGETASQSSSVARELAGHLVCNTSHRLMCRLQLTN